MSTVLTLQKCFAIAVFGAGVLSAQPACLTATLDTYLALGATGCTITATTPPPASNTVTILFYDFQFKTVSATAPAATDLLVTPLTDQFGIGFQVTPQAVPWSPSGNSTQDDEIQYLVKTNCGVCVTAPDWPGVDRLYSELQGTFTPPADKTSRIVEVFCPGGTSLPPDSLCPGANGAAQTIFVGPSVPFAGTQVFFTPGAYTPGLSGDCTTYAGRCVYPSIAVLKDIGANTTMGGTATITKVKNEVGPPTRKTTCSCGG